MSSITYTSTDVDGNTRSITYQVSDSKYFIGVSQSSTFKLGDNASKDNYIIFETSYLKEYNVSFG